MRVRIEAERTSLAPQILDTIATCMEHLNTPYQDILHARITLIEPEQLLPGYHEARVTLILEGKTLHVTRGGPSLRRAMDAALEAVAWALHGFRTRAYGRQLGAARACARLLDALRQGVRGQVR